MLPKAGESSEPTKGLTVSVSTHLVGPWKLTLTNEGTTPLRVLADGRFAYLEIIGAPVAEEETPRGKWKRPAKATAFPRGKIPVCRMPADMRPPVMDRMLILAPGHRYVETFDPVVFCGASKIAAEIDAETVVYENLK